MAGVLAFLASGVGRYVAGALLLLVAYGAGYARGGSRAEGKCEAAALRADLAAARQDLRLARDLAAMDAAAHKDAAALAAANQRIVDDLRSQPPRCRLSGDDARRLRGIR